MFLRSFLSRGVARVSHVSARPPDEVLRVSFERIVSGIVYHLVDEELATGVDQESLNDTLARLASDGTTGAVARSTWNLLSNCGRLQWLLDCAGVTVRIHAGRVASFRPFRWGDPYVLSCGTILRRE